MSGWGLWLEPLLPVRELVELARIAEDAGASHVFIADEGTDRDVYVTMTAIALGTRRLQIAAGITNPFSRHPVVTAAAFATLEELAPGRIVVGLGVGGLRVFGPMGLAPAQPFTALREMVDVVGRLLDGDAVSHAGTFAVNQRRIPWSRRRLPLAMAGRGPKVEQFAVTTADWLLLSSKPIAELPAFAASVRRRAADAGHEIRIGWSTYLGWTPEHLEAIRPHFTYQTVDMPEETRRSLGVSNEVAEEIRTVMLRDGIAAAAHLVPDAVVERAAVVGTESSVVEQLARVREAAAPDLFILGLADYATAAPQIRTAAVLLERAGFAPTSVTV